MSLQWNIADLFELVADTVPERMALAHGVDGVTRSWSEFDRRANALARHFIGSHQPGDKVSIYMHNRPEYLETLFAALKARLVPVNVNYRYRESELLYLFDNSDSSAVVYGEEAPSPRNDFATAYEEIVSSGADRPEIVRDPADLILLYTGGTTGMPKGVMWEQSALWRSLGGGGNVALGESPSESPEQHRERVADSARSQKLLPGCPLMHGTGQFTAINALANGGSVITLDNKSLDTEALWSVVEARKASALAIVGDAFAKPMLASLEARPGHYDLSACKLIVSSGVLWSPPVKEGILKHLPHALLMDSFGSSEAVGFGMEITTRDATTRLGKFRIGHNCKVFTAQGREVTPGGGEPGYIARSGPIPLGYYKDEAKTAETFREIDGVRWSIPGDWCTVNEDGSIDLLGRGSVCINTAGEKVHPEEVEEALKLHPAVADATVVGLPDEKWGEAVTGVVELFSDSASDEAGASDEASLREHVRSLLAGYKTPKRIVIVESVGRSPSGKADYNRAKALAKAALDRVD
jgi:fatty-acyl-CoA synthase